MIEKIIPGFFGLFALGLGLALLVAAEDVADDARLLAEEGVATQAEITRKYTIHTDSSDYNEARRGEGGSIRYYIVYRFKSLDGQSLESEDWVYKSQYDSVSVGSVHPVFYRPSKPEMSVLFANSLETGARIGWIAGSILIVVGLIVLALTFAWKEIRRWFKNWLRAM